MALNADQNRFQEIIPTLQATLPQIPLELTLTTFLPNVSEVTEFLLDPSILDVFPVVDLQEGASLCYRGTVEEFHILSMHVLSSDLVFSQTFDDRERFYVLDSNRVHYLTRYVDLGDAQLPTLEGMPNPEWSLKNLLLFRSNLGAEGKYLQISGLGSAGYDEKYLPWVAAAVQEAVCNLDKPAILIVDARFIETFKELLINRGICRRRRREIVAFRLEVDPADSSSNEYARRTESIRNKATSLIRSGTKVIIVGHNKNEPLFGKYPDGFLLAGAPVQMPTHAYSGKGVSLSPFSDSVVGLFSSISLDYCILPEASLRNVNGNSSRVYQATIQSWRRLERQLKEKVVPVFVHYQAMSSEASLSDIDQAKRDIQLAGMFQAFHAANLEITESGGRPLVMIPLAYKEPEEITRDIEIAMRRYHDLTNGDPYEWPILIPRYSDLFAHEFSRLGNVIEALGNLGLFIVSSANTNVHFVVANGSLNQASVINIPDVERKNEYGSQSKADERALKLLAQLTPNVAFDFQSLPAGDAGTEQLKSLLVASARVAGQIREESESEGMLTAGGLIDFLSLGFKLNPIFTPVHVFRSNSYRYED